MRFNPKARPSASDSRDAGGSGGGLGSGFGGGGGRGGPSFPLPAGRLGVGTIVLLVLLYVLVQCLGGSGGSDQRPNADQRGSGEACTGALANQGDTGCSVKLFTRSIQDFWTRAYPEQTGKQYDAISTVLFSGQTGSGCGTASSGMGPFYCPNDKRVYLDSTFFSDMLQGQLGARGGPFSIGYVIAHEYGHHIEDQLGVLGRMRTQKGPRSDSVRVELMADCLAGAWAKNAQQTKDEQGNTIISELNQDDIKRAVDAAQAVGDDRIQKRAQGRVNQEEWTHGSSAERVRWFNTGLQQGTIKSCDTFGTDSL